MKRILLLSFAFLTVIAFSAMAQRTVSGKVTDDGGEALPGVNVVIKGTTTGVTTDLDGNYRISVEDGATLIFSFVGFDKLAADRQHALLKTETHTVLQCCLLEEEEEL